MATDALPTVLIQTLRMGPAQHPHGQAHLSAASDPEHPRGFSVATTGRRFTPGQGQTQKSQARYLDGACVGSAIGTVGADTIKRRRPTEVVPDPEPEPVVDPDTPPAIA